MRQSKLVHGIFQINTRLIPSERTVKYVLTRHRLGCFCTHHSLEGGLDPTPPPAISKTDGRRETDEAAFERSRRDASKPLSKI